METESSGRARCVQVHQVRRDSATFTRKGRIGRKLTSTGRSRSGARDVSECESYVHLAQDAASPRYAPMLR